MKSEEQMRDLRDEYAMDALREHQRARRVDSATAITEHLLSLGWKRDRNYGGEIEITSPDAEYQVALSSDKISGDWWELGKFTDSDIDGVAVGRYRSIDEGQTLDDLEHALAHEKRSRS